MASFFDQFLGAEVELPDGMPADQRQAALGQLYQQKRQQSAMQTLGYLGQTIMNTGGLTGQRAPQRPAAIDPRAAFVMTPQALQSYNKQQEDAYQADAARYDAQQNRAAENQRQNQILAAQERIEVKRQLQAEKDSADRFKLQKMQYDNLMADRQFREKQAADKAKAEEKAEQDKLKRGTVHTRSDGSMINSYWDGTQWNVRPVAGALPQLEGSGGRGGRGGRGGGGDDDGYPLVGTLSDGSEVRNVSGRMTIIDPKTGAILGLYKGDAGGQYGPGASQIQKWDAGLRELKEKQLARNPNDFDATVIEEKYIEANGPRPKEPVSGYPVQEDRSMHSGYGSAGGQQPVPGTYNGVEGVKVGNTFYTKEEWIRLGGQF